MATRKGLSSKGKEDANKPLRVSQISLSGLADNSVLADQIVCVAMRYLGESVDCLQPPMNQRADINDSDCAWSLISQYKNTPWTRRDGSLKNQYDNPSVDYPRGTDFCAIFVWMVWHEACWCLGGVDGFDDAYLYKSARVYDTPLSMRIGTQDSGKTLVNKVPSVGSAMVRMRDNLAVGVGHAGIVVEITQDGFTCIEGNGAKTKIDGTPFNSRTYVMTDIAKYSMFFLHIENTPIKNAGNPRQDGRCCSPQEPPDIKPCDNTPPPSGENWEKTPESIFLDIVSAQGANQDAVISRYAAQGLEFSSEFCWVRHTNPPELSPGCDGFKCPEGYESSGGYSAVNYEWLKSSNFIYYEYERDANGAVTGKIKSQRPATQTDICCQPKKVPPPPTSKCTDVTLSKTNCATAIRVNAGTFIPASVPHYSVLYKNSLMGADITGSKWLFQTQGNKDTSMIGSALNLPKPAPEKIISNINGNVIEDLGIQFSGFGTFTDKAGNLIVICPEWQAARMNSLIGADKVQGVIGSTGYYEVQCNGMYTGTGEPHGQAADAYFICGIPDSIDGMNPSRSQAAFFKIYDNNRVFKSVENVLGSDQWFEFLVTDSNAQQLGLLNKIEFVCVHSGKRLDRPILVVLKSSPPPFDWLSFAKTVITIAASFSSIVGIPPQIFTSALNAVTTIEKISKGSGNVLGSIVELAGLVTAMLPAELRGNITKMLTDAGKEVGGVDGTAWLTGQAALVKQYLYDGQNFLNKLSDGVGKDAIGAMKGLGFSDAGANAVIKKVFGSVTNAAIETFKPNWYDFASDYSTNLGGDFNKGFRDGVNLLNSIESIQATQAFSRYAASGQLGTDIQRKGSVLGLTEFQSLMITGLGGAVMAATPNITNTISLMMNNTNDIVQGGMFNPDTNIGEIASMLKVANGFIGDSKDFSRLSLQALALKINGLVQTNKDLNFVLPPTLTQEQQECWGADLRSCFGITVVPPDGGVKLPPPPATTTLPPCIKLISGAYKYCPPPSCKVSSLGDDYNPSANYTLDCQDIETSGGYDTTAAIEILKNAKQIKAPDGSIIYSYNGVLYKEQPAIQGNALSYGSYPDGNGGFIQRAFYGLCEMIEVPATPILQPKKPVIATAPIIDNGAVVTPTIQPTPTADPCPVLYDAKTDGTKWYALLAGQWVEIIDCCPPIQADSCCDETQAKLNQMKLDLAKVIELVGRNQAGEKCPECDLSEIKKLIQALPQNAGIATKEGCNTIIQNPVYNDSDLRKEMREGFAEMRAMVGQIKQYDNSKDLQEIKDLIRAIKQADLTAVEKEIADLKAMIQVQQTSVNLPPSNATSPNNSDTNARYEELKNLILSRSTISQKDYSLELAQIQKDLDFLKGQFPITVQTIQQTIDNPNTPTAQIPDLQKLLTDQNDLFTGRIKELETKLTKPCEECTELAKLQTQIDEVKALIKGIKPSTNTIQQVSNPSDKTTIDQLTKDRDLWAQKYDEMFNAYTDAINKNNSQGIDTGDLKQQLDQQIENYTQYIQNIENKITNLVNAKQPEKVTVQQTVQSPTTSIPPVIQQTPQTEQGCTNCPKVVESHTRTIYEYPPVAPISAPCDDCEE